MASLRHSCGCASAAVAVQLEISGPQIAAVTANAFEEDRVALLTAGFDDFVSKPIPAKQLAELIVRQGELIKLKEARSKNTASAA